MVLNNMHYVMRSQQFLYPIISLKQKISETSWVDGTRFTSELPMLEFFVDDGLPFTWCDYFRPAANIPLFSERMKGWLDSENVDNIDYYRATVTHTKTGETRLYHAANILGRVLGMNAEKSDYDLFDVDSYLAENIKTLILDESKFVNVKLCRLEEYDLLVIAHQDLKSVMEAEKAQGVEFIEPEKWDGFSC